MRLSLAQRSLAITASALLPIISVLVFNEMSLRENREQEIRNLALSTARQAAMEMERLSSGAEGILQAVANAPAVKNLNNAVCTEYLKVLKVSLPQFSAIAVFDKNGFSRCRSDALVSSTTFADRSYFQAAVDAKGQLVIGEYTVSRITGRRALPFAVAMINEGDVVGVVASSLDLEWLGESLRARELANRASLTIADSGGTIIAREPLSQQFVGTKIPTVFTPLLADNAAGAINVTSQDGTERILGYVPLNETPKGLYISAGISRDEAFAAFDAATKRNVIIAFCGVCLAILLAWFLGNRLLRGPVLRIESTLAARRSGDDCRRTGLRPEQGDIEALGAEIDAYLDELNRSKAHKEQAEQHRVLLTQELSHRVKNLLATVQAIASQTFRNGGDQQTNLAVFSQRISAMAQAQQLLLLDRSDAASVEDAVTSSTKVFEPASGVRFKINGPTFRLRPEAAMSLAMATHELCTNAVKYGALSIPDGFVDVAWSLNEGTFKLSWTERGGPVVKKPERQGFGSRMIERVLAGEIGGTSTMHFDTSGVRCILEAPVSRLQAIS